LLSSGKQPGIHQLTSCPFACLQFIANQRLQHHQFFLSIRIINPSGRHVAVQTFKTLIMKKIFKNNRIIAIAFLTVFSLGAAPSAMAHEKKPDVPAQLTFLGQVNNQLFFQLSVEGNAMQNDFTITIKDEYGNSPYSENIKAENFTKKFLLDADELGDETLYFTVYCKSTKSSVEYKVNRNTRQSQEITVSEVK
jgi:hypothetical protein